MRYFQLIILTALISSVTSFAIFKHMNKPVLSVSHSELPATKVSRHKSKVVARDLIFPNFKLAANRGTKAVVNIQTYLKSDDGWWEESKLEVGSGSGVIISQDGYIVTNYHVIEDGNLFVITLNDKRKYNAKKIGVDNSTDLALLKIEEGDLPFIEFSDSDESYIGEWVLAIGNPFDLESTVTAGIISAKGRNLDILKGDYRIESFIQTDAVVNPGNSGGALVGTNGKLIGIITAIVTKSGTYEGYSFAIPSNLIRKIIRDIKSYGTVRRGFLGVRIVNVSDSKARELGLPKVEGVVVTAITPDSGAAKAGIRPNDVILKINDAEIPNVPKLQEEVAQYRPGNVLFVKFFRNGKVITKKITLKDKKNTIPLVNVNR